MSPRTRTLLIGAAGWAVIFATLAAVWFSFWGHG